MSKDVKLPPPFPLWMRAEIAWTARNPLCPLPVGLTDGLEHLKPEDATDILCARILAAETAIQRPKP